MCYAALALLAVARWRWRAAGAANRCASAAAGDAPALTLLKPLCGAEPNLYENLRTFCRQDYGEYQIVFGVREPDDPALETVRRLRAEFPALAIDTVVDGRLHGANYKVSNLINMLARARHELLVVSDSDSFVDAGYLRAATAPLADARVGLVSCLYLDVPTAKVWSRLGAMYINDWYMPSVLLAWLFGHGGYASGQTLSLRRGTLKAIGGLAATADHLAEDHRLGELVRAQGLRIALAPGFVSATHDEPSLRALVRHEERWLRTLRALRPRSFRALFLSFSLPLAGLGCLLARTAPSGAGVDGQLFLIVLALRLALHLVYRFRSPLPLLSDLWLIPVRDLLLCWVWMRSLFGSRIEWRGDQFSVDDHGLLHRCPQQPP